jgi:arylsulfatase A-like enzyme
MKTPNFIIVLCDDLGYGDLGCYGSTLNKTPRLDRMATEGVKFTDFYVSAPVCSPSRASLMTGCYAQRIGLGRGFSHAVLRPGDPIGISSEETTIAEMLKQRSYHTCLIGKWHLGDQPPFFPTRHGFDQFFGLPYSNDMKRDEGMLKHFPLLPLMKNEEIIEVDPDQSSLTERYTEIAVQYIIEHKDKPFFLYFAHKYVHLPLYATDRFLRQSQNGVYSAAVECIDWSLGRILDTLKEQGIDDNTMVIFTSDNGSNAKNGGSNAPLRGKKGTTWEGGMRMPCLMRWPGRIPAGHICRELATTMDLFPTLALLAQVDAARERSVDGKNIWPLISAVIGAKTPHEAFFYYRENNLEAVRSGPWKYHLHTNMLFNLEEDISESENLADRHPGHIHQLQILADRCRTELGDGGIAGTKQRPSGKVDHAVYLV